MFPFKYMYSFPQKNIVECFSGIEGTGQSVTHSFSFFFLGPLTFRFSSAQTHGNQIDFVVLDPSYCIFSIFFRERERPKCSHYCWALLCCPLLWKISRASGVGHSPPFLWLGPSCKSKTQIKTRPFLRLVISATRKKFTSRQTKPKYIGLFCKQFSKLFRRFLASLCNQWQKQPKPFHDSSRKLEKEREARTNTLPSLLSPSVIMRGRILPHHFSFCFTSH